MVDGGDLLVSPRAYLSPFSQCSDLSRTYRQMDGIGLTLRESLLSWSALRGKRTNERRRLRSPQGRNSHSEKFHENSNL